MEPTKTPEDDLREYAEVTYFKAKEEAEKQVDATPRYFAEREETERKKLIEIYKAKGLSDADAEALINKFVGAVNYASDRLFLIQNQIQENSQQLIEDRGDFYLFPTFDNYGIRSKPKGAQYIYRVLTDPAAKRGLSYECFSRRNDKKDYNSDEMQQNGLTAGGEGEPVIDAQTVRDVEERITKLEAEEGIIEESVADESDLTIEQEIALNKIKTELDRLNKYKKSVTFMGRQRYMTQGTNEIRKIKQEIDKCRKNISPKNKKLGKYLEDHIRREGNVIRLI